MTTRDLRMLAGVLACVWMLSCAADATPTATGAVCPADSTLTYETFGQGFMEAYCTRCHASDLHGADRHGASLYHDFDSLLGVLRVWEHVDQYAAAGPNSVNKLMPPDGEKPTLGERTQLGEWLACEQARIDDAPDAGPSADAGR
jgi:hypothetical protein